MSKKAARNPKVRTIVATLVGALILASGTQLLMGQGPEPYFELPLDPSFLTRDPETDQWKVDDRKLKPLQALKNNVVLGNASLAENSAAFDQWYTGYVFRSFSQLGQLSKLPQFRKEITDDLRKCRSKEVHDRLLERTMTYMTGFATTAKRNFHPAVRFNALLVIGDLNADEVSAQQRFPNPHPPALDLLISEYKRPNQTDAMKLAAMIGISRHVQFDWARPEANRIPADRRQEIMNLMLALANQAAPPEGKSPKGHAWMQRRALDILGALGVSSQADVDKVNQTVLTIVKNPDADMSLRITAAGTLGRLNDKSKSKPKLDVPKESLHVAALLMQACNRDLADIAKLVKSKQPGGMGAYGGMSSSGMPGMSMPGMGMSGSGSGYPGMSMPGMSMPGMGMSGSGMSSSGMPGMSMPGMGMPGMGMPGMAEEGSLEGESETGTGMMGSGMGMGMSSMGMMSGGPVDPYVELFRRRIKYEIVTVMNGLSGLRRLMPDAPPAAGKKATNPVDDMLTAAKAVLTATDPQQPTLPGLYRSVKDSLKDLEKMTVSVMPKPKPNEVPQDSDIPVDVPVAEPATAGTAAPGAGAGPGAAGQAGAAGQGAPAQGAPAQAAGAGQGAAGQPFVAPNGQTGQVNGQNGAAPAAGVNQPPGPLPGSVPAAAGQGNAGVPAPGPQPAADAPVPSAARDTP